MRGMIAVFDAYARMVRRATGDPVIVGDLVEFLLTRGCPEGVRTVKGMRVPDARAYPKGPRRSANPSSPSTTPSPS